MAKTILKKKILKTIEEVQDENVLKALLAMLQKRIREEEFEISDEDKADLDERLRRDKAGLEKGSSWNSVKARIKNRRKAA